MTNVLPDLRRELYSAAQRQAADPEPKRSGRRTLRIGAIVVALVGAGGTALAASGVWSPQLGDEHREAPRASHASAPAAFAESLGVLRRNATAADRDAGAQAALRLLDRRHVDGVLVDAVRRVSRDGGGYVAIPVEHAAGEDSSVNGAEKLCLFNGDDAGGSLSCFTSSQGFTGRAVTIRSDFPGALACAGSRYRRCRG